MRKVIYIGLVVALCWFAADCARAAELNVPQNAVAGQPLSIGTSGSGTLYLVGPGQVIKKEFKSGGSVEIKGEELRSAGRWIAVVRGDSNQSQVFWVKPGKPGKLFVVGVLRLRTGSTRGSPVVRCLPGRDVIVQKTDHHLLPGLVPPGNES